jgi:hypothetical protein
MRANLKHNSKGAKTHGLTNHPLYLIWNGIKSRCYNKNHAQYKDYGARGIEMCDEWNFDFKAFFDWCINNGWSKGLQIDKDIKGDGKLYSPDTCCIVTAKDNSSKRRSNVIVEYEGEKLTLKQVSIKLNLNYKLMSERMKKGWSFEKSMKTPLLKNQYSSQQEVAA